VLAPTLPLQGAAGVFHVRVGGDIYLPAEYQPKPVVEGVGSWTYELFEFTLLSR